MLFIEFALYNGVGAVDLLIGRISVSRFYDDGSVHAVGDMGQHRLGAAVVHEHAGIIRRIGEAAGFPGHHINKLGAGRRMHRMIVHGVGQGRVQVLQGQVDHVPLLHPEHRAGNSAVEGPGIVGNTFGDFHIGHLGGHFDINILAVTVDHRLHRRLVHLGRLHLLGGIGGCVLVTGQSGTPGNGIQSERHQQQSRGKEQYDGFHCSAHPFRCCLHMKQPDKKNVRHRGMRLCDSGHKPDKFLGWRASAR
ncbi:hypothetical protein D3C75_821480 [compost metagenome]